MRQIIGMGFILKLVLGLAACASSNPDVTQKLSSGEWKIEGRTDRVSDKPHFTASLVTRSRNARVEHSDPMALQLATLQLGCFDNGPVVRVHFSHAVGSNRNSRLSYRFDQNPGRDAKVRILQDLKTIVIEDRDEVVRFTDEMRSANNLIVQVKSLNTAMSSVDFKVGGAPAAIDAVFAGCLPAAQKPRVSHLPSDREPAASRG